MHVENALADIRNTRHSSYRSDWQRPIQLVSEERKQLARLGKFSHVTPSPYDATSNGKAESIMKIAKSLLRSAKRKMEKTFGSVYCNGEMCPHKDLDFSPCQHLMSRRARSLLPVSTFLLKPSGFDSCLTDKKTVKWNASTIALRSDCAN